MFRDELYSGDYNGNGPGRGKRDFTSVTIKSPIGLR